MLDLTNMKFKGLKATDSQRIENKLVDFLLPKEELIAVFKNSKHVVAFADKRIIMTSKKGLASKNCEFTMLPYSKINIFSCNMHGSGGGALALNIGLPDNIEFDFKNSDISDICRVISELAL